MTTWSNILKTWHKQSNLISSFIFNIFHTTTSNETQKSKEKALGVIDIFDFHIHASELQHLRKARTTTVAVNRDGWTLASRGGSVRTWTVTWNLNMIFFEGLEHGVPFQWRRCSIPRPSRLDDHWDQAHEEDDEKEEHPAEEAHPVEETREGPVEETREGWCSSIWG